MQIDRGAHGARLIPTKTQCPGWTPVACLIGKAGPSRTVHSHPGSGQARGAVLGLRASECVVRNEQRPSNPIAMNCGKKWRKIAVHSGKPAEQVAIAHATLLNPQSALVPPLGQAPACPSTATPSDRCSSWGFLTAVFVVGNVT